MPAFANEGKVKEEGKFVISIPPPNVTGSLHMGHALGSALQDTMIRRARMMGKTTAYIPGCDHAGISTQSVVEKTLWKNEKKTRHDIGREAMVDTIWKWKGKYHENITNQLKRMGLSVEWSREAFTMDENLSLAVRETFIQLHDEGIIYRANRLVNWCTALTTSLSNLEVDNIDLPGRQLLSVPGYEKKIEFGVLTHFRYAIEGSDKHIEVATTRPETMLGDTGIAVHPNDARYKDLVGMKAKHPFVDRSLTIFADEHVDPEFGTGAVKITPAHDPNDFSLGKKHNLTFINIFNDDGTLNGNTGDFAGMKRFDARYKVIESLKDQGLYVKWVDNPMKVPLCSKSKDIIEPIMKPQWWMRMESLAKPAMDVVRDGSIRIRPDSAERNFFMWMENIQDWCLSRQLWWGHRAPAYFVDIEGGKGDSSDGDLWVCAQTEEAAWEKAKKKFPGKHFTLRWDEDVLDTWFSSGLWPFSTLGWPKKTTDMETLYPTSVLETGWDILFFWVARMIMLGVKLTGQVPFTEVYCHSLIRDSEGRKMSKSLGNVVDPNDIIDGIALEDLHAKLLTGNLDSKEVQRAKDYQKSAFPKGINECGADALRFALVNYTTGGGDIAFDIKVIEAYRRFANKIYQATNFVKGRLGDDFVPSASPYDNKPISLAEKWILHRLNSTTKEVNDMIDAREFSSAAGFLYQYWLNQLCDTFIENSKFILQDDAPKLDQASAKQTLYTALEGGLLLLHPIMPFVTEHLWQKLPRRRGDQTPSIMIARYPQFSDTLDNPSAAAKYEFIMALSAGIRSLLSQYGFKEPGELFIQTYSPSAFDTASAEQTSIKSLGGKYAGSIEIMPLTLSSKATSPPAGCTVSPVGADAAVYLKIVGKVDLKREKERAEQSLAEASAKVEKSRKIMAAEGWGKVKSETREKEEKNCRDAEAEVRRFEEVGRELERLGLEG
jgi:valyl-tRNA synthetase